MVDVAPTNGSHGSPAGSPVRQTSPISASDVAKVRQRTEAASLLPPRVYHDADVFAYAGAQVKKAMEATKELGGVNYVFWGGREGYMNLYNTDLRREFDHYSATTTANDNARQAELQNISRRLERLEMK